ncbi:PD-(D/E)XK nuclease family protein [Cellulomonas composti]|uniref:PD-(D/E)XK nuclease family protein n=1 Tax=Cellulomonas composti TaxID=266130 RepID=UPI000A86CE74|nr:PD-(D/E)XK nuclease family protein [Cellulomonas composti]
MHDTGVVSRQAVLPDPPDLWSYSSLKDVETCPRRYALSRAAYPQLWEQPGYPRLPITAAIRGDVVHGALELIVKALVNAGCTSTRSAEAVAVLRELGGYTKVAETSLARQLARLDGNPRLGTARREQLARQLTDGLPQVRVQIQTYLNRMELRPSAGRQSGSPPSRPAVRYPARVGDHPEKVLVADSLRLMGRIDLLSVDATGVQITDFKTGAEDPTHHDQLQIYVLLWREDSLSNPKGLAVLKLVAAYPSRDIAAAVPSAEELTALCTQLTTKIDAADAAVAAEVPAAIVGDHCSMCNVRGVCDAYWTTGLKATADVAEGTWYDLAGTVLRNHGVRSIVLLESLTNAEVLVRTPTPSYAVPVERNVRVLGARRVVDPDDPDSLVAALTSVSEVLELA